MKLSKNVTKSERGKVLKNTNNKCFTNEFKQTSLAEFYAHFWKLSINYVTQRILGIVCNTYCSSGARDINPFMFVTVLATWTEIKVLTYIFKQESGINLLNLLNILF